ncbi:MAG TPA: alpha-glucan family phosphorylase [Ignavibacteria bacterium]|nr:alpha-glucan family phosphorylase [Ignavibacteria bacterium]
MENISDKKETLYKIANNLFWSWDSETRNLFEKIDLDIWDKVGHNPIKLLDAIDDERFKNLFEDDEFLHLFLNVSRGVQNYLNGNTWYKTNYPNENKLTIAYFSAEFGLTECVRIYSGGLGVLSGDHIKSASDLGIPLIGIGLLYSKGYFQQALDKEGWQKEYYIIEDFHKLPIELQRDENNEPLKVKVRIAGENVFIQIWKINLGRTFLYLLDTDIEINSKQNREITETLYGGDIETRIRQEIVMGIGGIRALEALNITPNVCHMNEGHSAFLSLERTKMGMEKYGLSFNEAKSLCLQSNIFTTHTPVPAGIDVFTRELINKCMKEYYREELKLSEDEFMTLGNLPNGLELSSFNMAHLAMNSSMYVNGVSKLHSIVSRELWADRFNGIEKDDIPIGSITNGVHLKTHTASNMQKLFAKFLPDFWGNDLYKKDTWNSLTDLPDNELWEVHNENKNKLINFTRQSVIKQSMDKGIDISNIDLENILNPDALTIGFARRFATYKRATLIFSDLEKLDKILNNQDHPVQIIFAGKAHPQDHAGKEFIQAIYKISLDERFKNRIVFLENYNLEVARYLVSGCDLWLNNPRRPLEASGTSGMKVVTNGGLNFSILDGWWDEAFTPDLGWKIGDRENSFNSDFNDEKDIHDLYNVLENEIIPLYFNRNEQELPNLWIEKVKNSISELSWFFNTDRMVTEYFNKYYIHALKNYNNILLEKSLN